MLDELQERKQQRFEQYKSKIELIKQKRRQLQYDYANFDWKAPPTKEVQEIMN